MDYNASEGTIRYAVNGVEQPQFFSGLAGMALQLSVHVYGSTSQRVEVCEPLVPVRICWLP
jgi:1-acyl-sn-glycerol-3-phosphate acyltransferase